MHVTVCVPADSTTPATGVGPRAAPSMTTLHQPPRAPTLSFPLPTATAGPTAGGTLRTSTTLTALLGSKSVSVTVCVAGSKPSFVTRSS